MLHGKQVPFGPRHTHLHLADWLLVVNGQSISQDGGRVLDGIASSELGLSRRRKLGKGHVSKRRKGNKSGWIPDIRSSESSIVYRYLITRHACRASDVSVMAAAVPMLKTARSSAPANGLRVCDVAV